MKIRPQSTRQVALCSHLGSRVLTAYSTNENLGSPSKVYDLLVEAAKAHPVAGNAEGSYLTMRSKEGAIFFVINIVGNFGTVFVSSLPSPLSLPTALASYTSLMEST